MPLTRPRHSPPDARVSALLKKIREVDEEREYFSRLCRLRPHRALHKGVANILFAIQHLDELRELEHRRIPRLSFWRFYARWALKPLKLDMGLVTPQRKQRAESTRVLLVRREVFETENVRLKLATQRSRANTFPGAAEGATRRTREASIKLAAFNIRDDGRPDRLVGKVRVGAMEDVQLIHLCAEFSDKRAQPVILANWSTEQMDKPEPGSLSPDLFDRKLISDRRSGVARLVSQIRSCLGDCRCLPDINFTGGRQALNRSSARPLIEHANDSVRVAGPTAGAVASKNGSRQAWKLLQELRLLTQAPLIFVYRLLGRPRARYLEGIAPLRFSEELVSTYVDALSIEPPPAYWRRARPWSS